MTEASPGLPETIECPLCNGKGELSRTEVLQRLGMKDYARVAQLSAEEAIRLLLKNEKATEQARWAKFELELTRRLSEVTGKHNAELQKLQTEKNELVVRLREFEKNTSAALNNVKQQERLATERELQKQLLALNKRIAELEAAQKLADAQRNTAITKVRAELEAVLNSEKAKANDLDRRVKDYFDEITKLRGRNTELEAEMAKVARVGKKEEIDFADEARSWPGVWIGEKLSRNGDYLMAFRDAAGNAVDPKIVVDNKDKAMITEGDIKKLIRDAHEHKQSVAAIIAHDESQLRQVDRECRWAQEDGIWLLRSTRAWLPRDLEVLNQARVRADAERGAGISAEKCRISGRDSPYIRRSGRDRKGTEEGKKGDGCRDRPDRKIQVASGFSLCGCVGAEDVVSTSRVVGLRGGRRVTLPTRKVRPFHIHLPQPICAL